MFTNDTAIEALNLSVRAYFLLKRLGVDTVGQARALTIEQLGSKRGYGRKSLIEIICRLNGYGVSVLPMGNGIDVDAI